MRWATVSLAIAMSVFATAALATPQNPATAQFNVTITILKQCVVTAPATINLGSVGASDLLTTPTSPTQPFIVTCSPGTGYTVGFSSTNDLSTGSATEQMKCGATRNTNLEK